MLLFWAPFVLGVILNPGFALDNGLTLTPPMGWLSWLWLGCETDCEKKPNACLSEDIVKKMTDHMAADGFKDAGYEYVIIDDCWLERDRQDGKLVPDKKRFKSGMKAMADYIHGKGLKFGMYEDIGNITCAGYPGLKDHEAVDATSFADWQIDYLKVDGCNESSEHMNQSYPMFGKLLNETGRPIAYSCSWPAYVDGRNKDYDALVKYCNLWRNYGDINASWGSVLNIMDWFGEQPELAKYAGPGHFHDPDMLVIGEPGISVDMSRAQMAVWSVLAAPLIMSTDLSAISGEQRQVLLNKDVIAVDQCPCGKMGSRINSSSSLDIWKREYKLGLAIAMVNRGNSPLTVSLSHADLHLDNEDYQVTDLYKEDKEQVFKKDALLKVSINGPGVKFYQFKPNGIWNALKFKILQIIYKC